MTREFESGAEVESRGSCRSGLHRHWLAHTLTQSDIEARLPRRVKQDGILENVTLLVNSSHRESKVKSYLESFSSVYKW